MTIELTDIIQTLGSIASLILIPIWRSISDLRKSQEETNIILAKEYVLKSDCENRNKRIFADILRIHERMDDLSIGRKV